VLCARKNENEISNGRDNVRHVFMVEILMCAPRINIAPALPLPLCEQSICASWCALIPLDSRNGSPRCPRTPPISPSGDSNHHDLMSKSNVLQPPSSGKQLNANDPRIRLCRLPSEEDQRIRFDSFEKGGQYKANDTCRRTWWAPWSGFGSQT
jgi:hypothetical protein